ncbi:hypothetical protein Tco_1501960 [Tanacetum coccineum]
MPTTERVLAKTLQGFNEFLYAHIADDLWENHVEAVVSYADLKAKIEGFHDQNPTKTEEEQPEEPKVTEVLVHVVLIEIIIPNPITTITTIAFEVPILEITPPSKVTPIIEAGGSSFMTPRAVKGKAITTESDPSPPKLAILDKKEQMEQAAKNSELSKHEIINVVGEVVSEVGVKISRGKEFIKNQDAHLKVIHKEHNEKLRKKEELKKKMYDNYEWIEFKFGDFDLSEWDELDVIIPTKKNQCVGDLMNSLSNKYERLKGIAKSLVINGSLPLPEQDPSLPSNRKRKAIELELEIYIAGMHCNRTLPEGVEFENKIVIEKPEHGLFFIDVFGDQSF